VSLVKDEHRLVKCDVHGRSDDWVQQIAVWAEYKICLSCIVNDGHFETVSKGCTFMLAKRHEVMPFGMHLLDYMSHNAAMLIPDFEDVDA